MPALATWWRLDLADLAPKAAADVVTAVGADLVRRLDEPHRSYHTTRHLLEMFGAVEELEDAGAVPSRDACVARVAAWFHDAVYDPGAAPGSNEEASADLAYRALTRLTVDRRVVATIRDLVLATERHDLPAEPLRATFHDADLWILSAPAARYAEYVRQVRQEYAAVPEPAFVAGRAAVLRPFIERESIYATPAARERWESSARANLAQELADLYARLGRA